MSIDRSELLPSRSGSHAAALAMTLALGACSADSDGGLAEGGTDGVPPTGTTVDVGDPDDTLGGTTTAASPSADDGAASTLADIARYGVIAVGDENGVASGDTLASFSRLSTNVATEAFGLVLDATANVCTVTMDDGRPDLMLASALYLPVPEGTGLTSIGAGDAVLLSSPEGSWLELQGQPSDRFYTRPAGTASPDGAVPTQLVANVAGDEFPAFADAAFADVTPLVGITYSGGDGITTETRFTWQRSDDPSARVRIETTSVASFFADDGLSVTCLAPDTGEFVFPVETRSALGAGFVGEVPDFSRLAFMTVRDGDALLVLARESFVR